MKHDWEDLSGTRPSDMLNYGRRRCRRCGAEQMKFSRQNWGRVIGYEWSPNAGRCKKLKWKKAAAGHQETHDGRYWVEQEPKGCGTRERWHAHRSDFDESLTGSGFDTRAEAKQYCEADYRVTR